MRHPNAPPSPAALAVLILSLAVPVPLAAARNEPFRIVPGPYVKNRAPDAAGAPAPPSRFTLGGLTVEVDLLGDAERAGFIGSTAPGSADPFAAPPGGPARFHTFRVRFDNRTASDVVFQPGNVLLVTQRGEQQFPIDIPDLYMQAARAGRGDPDALVARVQPLIFDSSTTIPAGERLERLLVFGPLPQKWREFRLHFSFLQIGTETHTLSFAFSKQILKA